ncbi:formate dehydrogenase accessory protein FdhE [Thermosyntropha sp.]|uniref:formate dehydrogenase accessory protein FdhE n=1 Tax=Thermosyntropha sp. TaxID=2740820 RepID=UPI0025D1212F|nr:formate dehydrogenase accessory protein FdhE [Thermosyntropha sp.]MBO8159276.1 formate dehydrogenase accessory protein FdhE [Thermosyntropha sp.]
MINRKMPVELPSGYIDFFQNLENWQNEQEIFLKQTCSFPKVNLIKILKENKKPLVKVKKIEIPISEYEELLKKFLSFLNTSRPDTAQAVDIIEKNINNLDLASIVNQLVVNENSFPYDLSEQLKISSELILFIFDHALRPFLRILASPYSQELLEQEFNSWEFPGICPVCAAKSNISRLRAEDGRRFMFCDRCFMEWEAAYLKCIYCGNNEPHTIHYINVENDDAYQIYICDKCKGYLKTYDERQAGEKTDLFIANIETIYLDMLAQEKGYQNHEQD